MSKYKNVSLSKETYAILEKLSKVILPDGKLSISKTIEVITNETFSGLSGLTVLLINKNRIPSLASNAFTGCPGLKRLHIDENGLTSIESQVFEGLRNLITLELGNNNISGK